MGFLNKIFEESNKNINEEKAVEYESCTKTILEQLGCPYQVFTTGTSADVVRDKYQEALVRGKENGFVPLLVVSDEILEEWLEILEDDEYSKEEMLRLNDLDGKAILDQRYQDYVSSLQEDGFDMDEWMGKFEEGDHLAQLTSFLKMGEEEIQETILVEIPVEYPWQVVAWLPIGGWNECPQAKEMMAICKYWYETYGAIPAVFSHDTIEFIVPKPIEKEDEAWELAKQHYAFSPDRVDQCTNTGTLGEVAHCLHKSKVWYFWWD